MKIGWCMEACSAGLVVKLIIGIGRITKFLRVTGWRESLRMAGSWMLVVRMSVTMSNKLGGEPVCLDNAAEYEDCEILGQYGDGIHHEFGDHREEGESPGTGDHDDGNHR